MKVLLDALNERYPSWLDWEPETMRLMLQGHIDKEEDINALMALQTALNTQVDEEGEFYFDNWRIFEKIVVALNGHVPDFFEVEKLLPEEIALAVSALKEVHPVSFGDEVAKYIAASFRTENLVHCPFWKDVDRHIKVDPELKKTVAGAWQSKDTLDLSDSEDPIVIQVSRLMDIESILGGGSL